MQNKEKFVISGLNGERNLQGEIPVFGSKNFTLPAMASVFLFENELILENVPQIEDVFRMAEILEKLGVKIKREGRKMTLKIERGIYPEIDFEIAKKLRGSIILLGPLLSRIGKVIMPHPGGCSIGPRPIDLFIENFKKIGAEISFAEEKYTLTSDKIKNTQIVFKNQSVTATTTFAMAGILGQGEMILINSALEPEVTELLNYFKEMGAEISGIGTTTLKIQGQNGKLLNSTKPLQIIPDRIEAGSFAVIGALAGKEIKITNCRPDHLTVFLETMREAGVNIETTNSEIKISKSENLRAINIRTHEYPGFPTDMQSPFTILLTQAKGESTVFETIFENRLKYTEDLVKMGAEIQMFDTHHITIKGQTPLRGRNVESPDLRAGLAFLIAGLIAKGQTEIGNAYIIDRGYEKIEERLKKLGAEIKRVKE